MECIKTKKDLLNNILKCQNGDYLIKGSTKFNIFEKYSEDIKNVITFLGDVDLPEFSSLCFSQGFCDFVANSTPTDLEDKLKFIYHDLTEWGKLSSKITGLEQMANIYKSHQNSSKAKKFKIFKVSIIFLIIVAATFTILSCFKIFEKWAAIIGAVIGVLDFIFGLSFQLYERKDDLKQKKELLECENEIKDRTADIDKITAGKINNVQVGENNGIIIVK